MSAHREECFGTLTTLDVHLYFTDKPEDTFFFFNFPIQNACMCAVPLWNPRSRVLYSCDVASVPLPSL